MIINLLGGQRIVYTDYSVRPVYYWDEYYYNTSQSNAIYREWEELTYEDYDTILVGQRQVEFIGLYYNSANKTWQQKPYSSNSGTPRGGSDEPISTPTGIYTGTEDNTPTTFFGGFAERANGSARLNGTQINPYLQAYTGTTNEDRIVYLKAALKWLEVEIKSEKTQLERDLRILKNVGNRDEKEIKIIEAAGLILTSVKGLQIPGMFLTGAAQLGTLFNKSNATKAFLTESVTTKTEKLEKYVADYIKLKAEYDALTQNGGSSDSGLDANKKQLYWIVGSLVVAGIIIYFFLRRK